MFIWDFDAFFAVFLFFGVGLVLTLWIRYNRSRKEVEGQKVSSFLKYCQYCTYVYLDYKLQGSRRCPRCLSYCEEEIEHVV